MSVRHNSVGEMYTFDRVSVIMHQVPVKSISAMPASMPKFEKDLTLPQQRAGTQFPGILMFPILIQMIPTSWKR